MYDLGIIHGEVYLEGVCKKTNLYINHDHIVAINDVVLPCKEVYDAEGKIVMPGLIDPHVHFALNIGKYTSVDDFYSGSITAAYGGITTFIDFLDPVSKGEDLEAALATRSRLAKRSMIDYMFHATVMNPVGEVDNIVKAMHRLRLNSVKLFTTYSDSNRRTYNQEIKELLDGSEGRYVVLAHAEKDDLIDIRSDDVVKDLPRSRPERAETEEALNLARMVEDSNGRLYMVHVSSGRTVEALKSCYDDLLGERFFLETCPHYLYLNDQCFQGEKAEGFAMAPPLRDQLSVEKLRSQVDDIHSVGTDHCPFNFVDKKDKLLKDMPMGIGGVEHSFALMYSLWGDKAIEKMSTNPAKIFGLYPQKGSLQLGTDADIAIFDPSVERQLKKGHSNCDFSAFEGLEVKGQVESTLCKGQFVIKYGELVLGSVGHLIINE